MILDLIMPGMGGQKCFQELLKINPKIKVIISTGASAEEQVREAFNPHPVGFVSKPYQLKDMLAKVREVLDARPN